MQPLKVTLVQTELTWHNPQANRDHMDTVLAGIEEDTHLIVLPEMFTTGFTMNPEEVAEEAGGPTTDWLLDQAKHMHAAVCGSVCTLEDDDI